jgi:hypothetical protein
MKNYLRILLVLVVFFGIGLAYSFSHAKSQDVKIQPELKSISGRIDSFNYLGNEFVFYQIPNGLSREELIAVARKIHTAEPNVNLILVDDISQVQDYIKYAEVINPGYLDPEMPKEWADRHIMAIGRKYGWTGRFVLCEGYGYQEIAELK